MQRPGGDSGADVGGTLMFREHDCGDSELEKLLITPPNKDSRGWAAYYTYCSSTVTSRCWATSIFENRIYQPGRSELWN
jgi:hypothetical protein